MSVPLPLQGLRVVDMADEKAELCGRLLADLGADVVRVEPPGGAVSRTLPPFHDGTSLAFAVRNTNKRGVTLDLTAAGGRGALLALLEGADVWVETSRPGELAARDLDPRDVAARVPHLVVVSVTDFGQTGPYRGYVATDAVMQGMAWMLFRAGVPDLPPVLAPGPIAYDTVGVTAAFAALTAYLDRCATGRGQHVDVSVMEALLQTTDWALASYSLIRQFGTYREVRDGGGKVYPIVPCADGFVRPAMVTTAEWRKLRDWMSDLAVLQTDDFDQSAVRIEVYEEVIEPAFVEFFADKTMLEASIEGQLRGIPITPMFRPADVLDAEQFDALGSFVDADLGEGRRGRLASGFYVVDGERMGYRASPPVCTAPSDSAPAWCAPSSTAARVRAEPGMPYSGLRVLEFGQAGAAPEMGRLLAEYGADVIRVESPSRPDVFRQLGAATGVGPPFCSSNRSTRSFAVEFTEPEGAALVLELARHAHVVVENLSFGALERIGLGAADLHAANPELLVISSQTMGRRGPWSHWRGYGSNTQLPSGLSYLWSFPDAPVPVPQNVAFPDHLVGRLGALAVAADVIARARGLAGARHVELAQAEMALNLLADLLLEESLSPGSVRPQGNRSARGAPWGVYPCAGEQRWCVITCRSDAEWSGLVDAMGEPEWTSADAWRTAAGRLAHQDELDRHVAAWTTQHTDREVMVLLQARGVPAGMMMYPSDQPDDPQLRERGYLLDVDQPGLGSILLEGPAFHATRLPAPRTFPAPLLGQHTRDIAVEVLGLPDRDVDELVAAGTLEVAG
ncbi:MAG TPA: CoA transferase [Acidimicrobiia bacterium]|nr:CoA transferase [Acidimicrobiia bacterium]